MEILVVDVYYYVGNRVIKCDKPHHELYTAAVRTCAKFQIASDLMKVKIERFGVLHSPTLISLI